MNPLQLLKETEFNIDIDHNDEIVYVKQKVGAFLICFVANYTKTVKGYIGASYSNPEEYSLIYQITKISEIEIYKQKEFIELSDDDYEKAIEILSEKLIGNLINC